MSSRQKPTTISMKSLLDFKRREKKTKPLEVGSREKTEPRSTWWRKKNELKTKKPQPLESISMRSWENKKERNWGEEQEAPGEEEKRISWQDKPTTPVSRSKEKKRTDAAYIWGRAAELAEVEEETEWIRLVLSLWFTILQKLKYVGNVVRCKTFRSNFDLPQPNPFLVFIKIMFSRNI